MKKKTAVLLACVMAAAMIFTGCGSDEAEEAVSISVAGDDDEITAETLLQALDYDIFDYVTLPDDYMNLTVELTSSYEVTDDDVRDYIENYVLVSYPAYVESDKTQVEDGDIANIDYVGTLDGEAFDGGSDEGYNLTIGSGTFIDGFEDGLIGVNVGDTVDLNLTFPEEYSNEDLAGQDVVFTVTVNSIVEEQILDYEDITDEYIEENFSVYSLSTVEDFNEYIEEGLASSYESSKQSEIQSLVVDQLAELSEVNIPEDVLENQVESVISNAQESAEYYGIDYDEYISTYYGYDDEDSFRDYVYEYETDYLTEDFILRAIVADQGISISRSDFDTFVDYFVSYYGYSSADDIYEDYGGEDFMMLEYAESIALNTVVDATTVIVPESEVSEEDSTEDDTEKASEEDDAEETSDGEGETEDAAEEE